jgi:hypothetical protein
LAPVAFLPLAAEAAAPGNSGPTLQWTTVPSTSGPSTTGPSTTSPPPLAYAAAAYDGDNSTYVLFGGVTQQGGLSATTWIWNGTKWSQPQTVEPPARELASMAFDPKLHQLILFGGQSADGALLGDTWAWNGASWVQIDQPTSAAPPAREAGGLAYDQAGNLLLFGGTGYTATTTPSTSSTTLGIANTTESAPAAAMTALSDTWEWTANGWVQRSVSGPTARSGPALSYDSHDGTDVLFGGEATPAATGQARVLSDTWLWNGSKWTQAKPATSPPARFAGVAADFPPLGGALLLSGNGGGGDLGDAWVWVSGKWTSATIQGAPAARQGATGAYDSAKDYVVVFGGTGGGGGTLGDTGLVALAPPKNSPTTAAATTTTTPKPAPTTVPPRSTTTTVPRSSPVTGANPGTTPTPPGPAPNSSLYLETSVRTVHGGSSVRLAGAGFAPGTAVQLTFHSTPALLGWATVDGSGHFSKVVDVPANATTGTHHIVASGRDSKGGATELTAAVFVMSTAHHGISTATTFFLLGLALLIPVGAYLVMAGLSWRRQRAAARLQAK